MYKQNNNDVDILVLINCRSWDLEILMTRFKMYEKTAAYLFLSDFHQFLHAQTLSQVTGSHGYQ